MAEKIAIIIVNYKNWPDTLNCLDSLPSNKSLLKIVIEQENAKPRNYSGIKFIYSKDNIGFAAANNLGIKYALEKKCNYIFLLNNDTILKPGTITQLIAFMQHKPKCGICSPVNYFYQIKDIAFSGGKINPFTGLTPHLHDQPAKNRQTKFITGASMFIRAAIFEKAGLMSEDYFLYYEDSDFCEKVKRTGYELWIVAKAGLVHKVSQTAQVNPFIYYYCQRNRLLFFSRHCPIFLWPIFLIFFCKDILLITLRGLLKPRHNNNFKIFLYSWCGVFDYLQGRLGKNNKL